MPQRHFLFTASFFNDLEINRNVIISPLSIRSKMTITARRLPLKMHPDLAPDSRFFFGTDGENYPV